MSPAPRSQPSVPPWSAGIVAALLLTLERPAGWAIALAGFLARGGLVVFLLPIMILPTPAGLQAQMAPLVVPFLFGEVGTGVLVLAAALAGLVLAWLVIGGLIGAWTDVQLIRDAVAEDAITTVPAHGPRIVMDVLAARLITHAPLAVALAWGAARIVATVYAELLTPFEVVTPIAVRIVAGAPDAVGAVVATWLLGEAAGGLAAREVAVMGRAAPAAAVAGWIQLLGRPLASAGTFGLTSAALVIAVAPGLVAATVAWSWVRAVLFGSGQPGELVVALAAFVGLWLGALALAGFGTALRSNAWTTEWLRRRSGQPEAPGATPPMGWPIVGTIGDAEATRPGGWPSSGASGTV